MTKYLTIASFFLLLATSQLFASSLDKKALILAEQGVTTKDANGEDHQTMVDANGNLKIIPLDAQGKPIDPDAIGKNGPPSNNMQVTTPDQYPSGQ